MIIYITVATLYRAYPKKRRFSASSTESTATPNTTQFMLYLLIGYLYFEDFSSLHYNVTQPASNGFDKLPLHIISHALITRFSKAFED